MDYDNLIKNFENKIKELVVLQNQNQDSNDFSQFALFDYIEREEEIDRLELCIKLLRKKRIKENEKC